MVSSTILPGLDTSIGTYRNTFDKKGAPEGTLVEEVISRIKGPGLEAVTNTLRSLSGEEFTNYKIKSFQAVTWSGLFSPSRSIGNLVKHSGLLCLDIDDLPGLTIDEAKGRIAADPHTFICFVSPSGNGLKVVVRLNLQDPQQHSGFFSQVAAYYQQQLGIMVDLSGRDVSRLCFLSHDPDVFVNSDSQTFELDEETKLPVPAQRLLAIPLTMPLVKATDEEIFEWCLRTQDQKLEFVKGQRNHYLTALANFCNDFGVSKAYCEAECLSRFSEEDFTEGEIKRTINSIYSKTMNHGMKVYNPSYNLDVGYELVTTDSISNDGRMTLAQATPNIPAVVYQKLPDLLKRMCDAFSADWERDTFLTSVLVVLSGCFPNVFGSYKRTKVFANLNSLIIAPPASGKGAMIWAKKAVDGYSQKVIQRWKDNQPGQEESGIEGEVGSSNIPGMLFIPANTSGAALMQALKANNGQGIIFETEADTLSATLKQDWGNFSDMIRKGFHHEPITSLRSKDGGVYIGIDYPKFSIGLSGTPAQLPRLIPSAEDGTFSRFILFSFEDHSGWQDVGPDEDQVSLDEYFEDLQPRVTAMIELVENLGSVKFDLQKHQWAKLNLTFEDYWTSVHQTIGGNAISSVKRLGLITFRLAMVLSIVRKAESGEAFDHLICTDTDFEVAMALSHTYLQHMISIYINLPAEKLPVKSKTEEKMQREQEIMQLIRLGHSNRETARMVGVSEGTVRNIKMSA